MLLGGCNPVDLTSLGRLELDHAADPLPFPEPSIARLDRLPEARKLSPEAYGALELRRAFFRGDFAPLDRAINADHERLAAGQGEGKLARALVRNLVKDVKLAGIDRCRQWTEAMPYSYAAHWFCGAMWVEGAWQSRTEKYMRDVSPAQIAIMEERMVRARVLLRAAINLSAKPVEVLTLLANSYLSVGEKEAGSAYLEQAERAIPSYAPLHQTRANFSLPQWGGRQEAVKRAVERARASGVGEEALLELEDDFVVRPWETPTPGAEKQYWDRAIAAKPTYSRLEALLNYYWRLNGWQEMLPIAKRMIELEPENSASYYPRAVAYEKLGRVKAALADYRTAAALGHDLATDKIIRAHVQGHFGLPAHDWRKLYEVCRYGGSLGVPSAANCLGSAFFEAEPVNEPFRRDLPQALAWHLLAARGGYYNSQHDLGWLLYTGRTRAASDVAKDVGIFWLRRAAEQGHEFAKRKLTEAGYSPSEIVGPKRRVLYPLQRWVADNPTEARIAALLATVMAAVGLLLTWRQARVARGTRRRDQILLDRVGPIRSKLLSGEPVSSSEIDALAKHPENRHMLFSLLRTMARSDLLPSEYSSSVAQGESALAFWLMHPDTFGSAPEAIELVETIKKDVGNRDEEFHVYRFRMPIGRPTSGHGWILGVTGPMRSDLPPYADLPGAFSRASELYGRVRSSELVDKYSAILRLRSGANRSTMLQQWRSAPL